MINVQILSRGKIVNAEVINPHRVTVAELLRKARAKAGPNCTVVLWHPLKLKTKRKTVSTILTFPKGNQA